MAPLITRRVGFALAMIVAASALAFAAVSAAPGNVAALIAERIAGPAANAELIEKIAEDLGLDDPLPVRYANWLRDAVSGDFGESLRSGKPIAQEFSERVPVTATLLLWGGAMALLISLPLGLAGAVSNGGIVDKTLRPLSLVAASAPNFFVAALLVLLFSVALGWLSAFGGGSALSWIMPGLSVALFPGAVLSRVVRVNLQDAMSQPFATTGLAKGLSRPGVLLVEALPTIAVPYLTTFGAQFALMIIGSIIVETVFALKGIGAFFIEVIRFRDFIGMQAVLLLFIAFSVCVNLAVDIVCMLVDPRLRRARDA